MFKQRNFFREFPTFFISSVARNKVLAKGKVFIWTLVFISLLGPAVSFAKVGVGLNFGRIVVDEPLKPGTTYDLPTIG
ncbi:MAG: hypothetical protein HY577_00385, partial [Candidatus Nealsonbacteria bacterium]|nr:hypothetical protein [Candidatus Nealsonbacteria bacterium]